MPSGGSRGGDPDLPPAVGAIHHPLTEGNLDPYVGVAGQASDDDLPIGLNDRRGWLLGCVRRSRVRFNCCIWFALRLSRSREVIAKPEPDEAESREAHNRAKHKFPPRVPRHRGVNEALRWIAWVI